MENSNEPINMYAFKGNKIKYAKFFPLIVALILLAIWLISGFRLVSATEVAVVQRLGLLRVVCLGQLLFFHHHLCF